MTKAQNVVPAHQGGWNIKRNGAQRATKHFDTKAEAVNIARKIARNQGAELVIHDRHGRIQQKDSHGNNPFSPKG